MSQSCFSLGFLSQNFLWRLSTFHGYKGIYNRACMECKESITTKQVFWRLGLATGTSREFVSRANYLARLEILSCSATTSVTLMLPSMFHMCTTFGDLLVARSSRKALLECIFLSFSLHSLTHYPYMIPT